MCVGRFGVGGLSVLQRVGWCRQVGWRRWAMGPQRAPQRGGCEGASGQGDEMIGAGCVRGAPLGVQRIPGSPQMG